MPLQVVLPEEALVTELALVAAHLAVAAVHVRSHVRPVKEALVTLRAVELVCALVQPLVLDIAGVGEKVLLADLTGAVGRQLGLVASGQVLRIHLLVREGAPADTAQALVRLLTHPCLTPPGLTPGLRGGQGQVQWLA